MCSFVPITRCSEARMKTLQVIISTPFIVLGMIILCAGIYLAGEKPHRWFKE